MSQNRLREKRFLARRGFPLAPWRPVRSHEELAAAVAALGLPIILKTAASGYDGKGQVAGRRRQRGRTGVVEPGAGALRGRGIGDVRGRGLGDRGPGADGRALTYPVGLNRHERHILDSTVMPAPVGPASAIEARGLALAVAEALGTVGVLTVEFFLTADGDLARQRAGPPAAQLGAPDDRGGGVEPVRAAGSGALRPAAGVDRAWSRPAAMVNLLGDLWSARRAGLVGRSGGRPGGQAPSLRQADARAGPEDGAPDRP